jgi:hypothetical protein
MTRIRRLLLDVLKPRQPGVVELGSVLAAQGELQVKVIVAELDDRTETLQIEITGSDIDFERVCEAINEFGASLHSVDEVEVESGNAAD